MIDGLNGFIAGLFTFRSPEHFHWFIMSAVMLVVAAALVTVAASSRKELLSGDKVVAGESVFMAWAAVFVTKLCAAYHGLASLMAAVNLIWTYMPEWVASSDCVWFNALMAAIHFGLHRRSIRLAKLKPKTTRFHREMKRLGAMNDLPKMPGQKKQMPAGRRR